MNASQNQHGGDHYKRMSISPWDVIDTWPLAERIGFYRGNLLKYTMRMHDKDAPADNVGKAEHYAAKLREVLEQLVITPNADGWIEWNGGECPVDPDTRVEFKMRVNPVLVVSEVAGYLEWSHNVTIGAGAITHYRVAK